MNPFSSRLRPARVGWLGGLAAALAASAAGCGWRQAPPPPPAPRPITALVLQVSEPGRNLRATGVATSWKSENLGFEVAGRIEFVIEPEQEVGGGLLDGPLASDSDAHVLARLDPTRFELQVASTQAQIAAVRRQQQAVRVEIEQVMTAELRAAEANLRFRESEFRRNEPLAARGAISASELDRFRAERDAAQAQTAQIEAAQQAKAAEYAALEARVEELQQALADAQRNVADCVLRAPYPGQVAEVHVIKGGVVERGNPVVTLQLMDPIKIEFEVSAERARALRHGDPVTVFVPGPDGAPQRRLATLYMIGATADPETRTFTVTLLLLNERQQTPAPAELAGEPLARTKGLARVFRGVYGERERLVVSERALHQDAQGWYLWRVLNRQADVPAEDGSPVLRVAKLRVERGEFSIPIFGVVTLREFTPAPGETLDPATDVFAGELRLPPGAAEPWEGDTLLLDRQRWLLRPGDLVRVDASGVPAAPGLYVPMDAIQENNGTTCVFVIEKGPEGDVVRRTAVRVGEAYGAWRRIEAAGDSPLAEGARIAADGAAFLTDGEPVSVLTVREDAP